MSTRNSTFSRWVARLAFGTGVGTVLSAALAASVSAYPIPPAARMTAEAAAGPRAVAASASGQVLGGFTSQGWPVVAVISADQRFIQLAATGLDMTCTSGARFPTRAGMGLVPIGAKGRFHMMHGVFPQAGSTVSVTGGSESLSGRLDRRRAILTGHWRLQVDFKDSSGQADHCDSGSVGFSATR